MQSRLLHRLRASRLTAVLVGLGGVFAGAGRASATSEPELALRLDGGTIQLAERGGDFAPLALADTPAAGRLHALLAWRGTVGLAPSMIADGGQGFSLERFPPDDATAPATRKHRSKSPVPPETTRAEAPERHLTRHVRRSARVPASPRRMRARRRLSVREPIARSRRLKRSRASARSPPAWASRGSAT